MGGSPWLWSYAHPTGWRCSEVPTTKCWFMELTTGLNTNLHSLWQCICLSHNSYRPCRDDMLIQSDNMTTMCFNHQRRDTCSPSFCWTTVCWNGTILEPSKTVHLSVDEFIYGHNIGKSVVCQQGNHWLTHTVFLYTGERSLGLVSEYDWPNNIHTSSVHHFLS